MTREEAIRLAERVADDLKRADAEPPVMVADMDDDTGQIEYLNIYWREEWAGRLYSERDYERLAAKARRMDPLVLGILASIAPSEPPAKA